MVSKLNPILQVKMGNKNSVDSRLNEAVKVGNVYNVELVSKLIQTDKPNKHTLFIAAYSGNVEIVELLLAYNANPNLTDESKETALHKEISPEIMELLLKANANPNIKNYEGQTPLIKCSSEGRSACVDLLLKHGAKINIKDRQNRKAAHMAHRMGHMDIFNKLCQHDADSQFAEAIRGLH
jgi:ankyrin repeat protein